MASAPGPGNDHIIQETVHGSRTRSPRPPAPPPPPHPMAILRSPPPPDDRRVPPMSPCRCRRRPLPVPAPPPAAPVESLTPERASEQRGDGGDGGSSPDAAAVDRKGEKIAETSPSASADTPRIPALSQSSLQHGVGNLEQGQGMKLPWDDPRLWAPVTGRKKSLRSTSFLGYIGNVFLCRKGRSLTGVSDPNNRKEPQPVQQPIVSLVRHQKISLAYVPEHYCLLPGLRGIISSNFLILLSKYSEFRTVHGDGECFYRSFIISYLEQVLDREDTDEEQRLLAAVEVEVKPMAVQIDYPKCATAFSWSHKVFKELIQNIIGWKSRQNSGSRKKELLKFFSSESMSNGIFVFLRSVAATWMCAHKDEYEPHIPAIGENYPLELWCDFHILPRREYTDHIPMRALAAALGVPLRVENLHNGPAHDIYTADGINIPRVTVLYSGMHYDILYPRVSSGGSSRYQAAQGEG